MSAHSWTQHINRGVENIMNVCAQELRNAYIKFYDAMRSYLWSYETLENLANAEVGIYTAFTDVSKLQFYLDKLWSDIKEVCKDDEVLRTTYQHLRDIVDPVDITIYAKLPKVQEVDPSKDKILKSVDNDDEEDTL